MNDRYEKFVKTEIEAIIDRCIRIDYGHRQALAKDIEQYVIKARLKELSQIDQINYTAEDNNEFGVKVSNHLARRIATLEKQLEKI
jgi:hypothetical protein